MMFNNLSSSSPLEEINSSSLNSYQLIVVLIQWQGSRRFPTSMLPCPSRESGNNIQYCHFSGCLQVLESMTPLLKAPWIWVTGLGGTELQQTWKPPLCGILIIDSKDAVQATKGEKHSIVLLSCKLTGHQAERCLQK